LATITSLFSNRSIPAQMVMTGEITLRGQVLPVGGIKEKLIAAHRYGKNLVIIPKANMRDLVDIPPEIKTALTIYAVDQMSEVLEISGLVSPSEPKIEPIVFEASKDPQWWHQEPAQPLLNAPR
jgi:ATP-dependent Lon protease